MNPFHKIYQKVSQFSILLCFPGVEFMSTGKWNVIGSMGISYFWALGYVSLPGVAYLVPDWNDLQIVLTLPAIFLLIISFFIPESPMWLLTQGRVEEAETILRRIAKFNSRPVPDDAKLRVTSNDTEVR